ncbi:glutathione transferase GstA [Candidatus Methylocalor cossyra]|uniref:Glutathione S-transferase GST-6.0 n=1 Tax=Candidatus Methylocalor cossyra TaxID=3108543 RepID=A0ABM9NJP4_9GAMM
MKLYYTPGACSLAVHIVLREAGLPFELEKVDLATKKTEHGADFLAVNAKGYVPALGLDDGQVLTEDQVILQYLADRKPEAGLAPPFGTMERYRLMEWLGFIASEVHKGFGPLWNPSTPDATRENALALLGRRFDYLAGRLEAGGPWLLGDRYTVADAYLYTVLRWCDLHKVDLGRWPGLTEYRARVAGRPAVREAVQAEGLPG